MKTIINAAPGSFDLICQACLAWVRENGNVDDNNAACNIIHDFQLRLIPTNLVLLRFAYLVERINERQR